VLIEAPPTDGQIAAFRHHVTILYASCHCMTSHTDKMSAGNSHAAYMRQYRKRKQLEEENCNNVPKRSYMPNGSFFTVNPGNQGFQIFFFYLHGVQELIATNACLEICRVRHESCLTTIHATLHATLLRYGLYAFHGQCKLFLKLAPFSKLQLLYLQP
jgi:hypothetical protein